MKALGALQKPFAKGDFTRRAFTREELCEGHSEAPGESSSLPHAYTHAYFSLSIYRYGAASLEG